MKKILLIISIFVVSNFVFSQTQSPYYEKANEQLTKMIQFFDDVNLPLNETQKQNILKINIGILEKTDGINSSESTIEVKNENLNNLKIAHQKFILKQLTEPQKEKFKDLNFSDQK